MVFKIRGYKRVKKAQPNKFVVHVTTGKFVWIGLYSNGFADEYTFTMAESPKYAYFLDPAKADNDTAFVNVNLDSVQNTSWMLTYNPNNELVEGVAGGEEVEVVADHKGGLEYADNTFALAIDTAYVNRVNNKMPLYYIVQQGAVRGEDLLQHPNATRSGATHPFFSKSNRWRIGLLQLMRIFAFT